MELRLQPESRVCQLSYNPAPPLRPSCRPLPPPPLPYLVFGSTFSRVEGLHELASIALAGQPARAAVVAESQTPAEQGMVGKFYLLSTFSFLFENPMLARQSFILMLSLGAARSLAHTPAQLRAPHPAEVTVAAPCAVLYSPDAARIVQMKRLGPLSDFYTVANDNLYYLATTRDYLQQRRIKVLDTDVRRVRFVRPNGTPVRVVAIPMGWGLLLFNGRTAPVKGDLANPEADVRRVFGK